MYALMAKWYILIAIPSIMVTYWTFTALEKSGYLDTWYNTAKQILDESQSIAQNCIPKFLDVAQRSNFIDCLENPPIYSKPKYQQELENNANRFLTDNDKNHPLNPYDDWESTNDKQPKD